MQFKTWADRHGVYIKTLHSKCNEGEEERKKIKTKIFIRNISKCMCGLWTITQQTSPLDTENTP
jgi:hypothetical protein